MIFDPMNIFQLFHPRQIKTLEFGLSVVPEPTNNGCTGAECGVPEFGPGLGAGVWWLVHGYWWGLEGTGVVSNFTRLSIT